MINKIKEKVGKAGLIGGAAIVVAGIATGAITFMARKDKKDIINKIKENNEKVEEKVENEEDQSETK